MVVRLTMYSLFLVLSYICFCRLYVNGSGPTVTKIFESCTQLGPGTQILKRKTHKFEVRLEEIWMRRGQLIYLLHLNIVFMVTMLSRLILSIANILVFPQQINAASSYIDGSFVYGKTGVRASYLRHQGTGKLASLDLWEKFPVLNTVRLPFLTFPNKDDKTTNPETLWSK